MLKENIKLFFGKSFGGVILRIILGLILFMLVDGIYYNATQPKGYMSDTSIGGWPFHYVRSIMVFPTEDLRLQYQTKLHREYNTALISDIVLWYLVSCLVAFVYLRIRSK